MSHEHEALTRLFPLNPHVQRLIEKADQMNITFSTSPVESQWLYHPEHRTIYVWEEDLRSESLSYIVVILAHELGHAVDFDTNRDHLDQTRDLHWSEVPDSIEIAAFVYGFNILKELSIPVSLDQYEMMIAAPLAQAVRKEIQTFHTCCLLSAESPVSTSPSTESEAAS